MAEYTTFVFRHANLAARNALHKELGERFPFGADGLATCIVAMSSGDAMSVSDAMAMALDCSAMDPLERIELAQEMNEALTWEGCLGVIAKWDLVVNDLGELVDAPSASGIEAATAGETQSGSTVGESPTGEAGDAQERNR